MRASAAILTAFAALGLGACNANPLLTAAASDYAPIKVGSQWSYRSPDGNTSVTRRVSAEGTVNGRDAFTVDSSVNGAAAGSSYLAWDDGQLLQWNSTLGWILYRRLPLVNGNKWEVPSTSALVTTTVVVDAIEKVSGGPLGEFPACFKVRTRTDTYSAGTGLTTTAESLAWAAPGIGDVRYATLDDSGGTTITLDLTSYSIP